MIKDYTRNRQQQEEDDIYNNGTDKEILSIIRSNQYADATRLKYNIQSNYCDHIKIRYNDPNSINKLRLNNKITKLNILYNNKLSHKQKTRLFKLINKTN